MVGSGPSGLKFLEAYSVPGNRTRGHSWGTWNSVSFRFGVQAMRGMEWLVLYNWMMCLYLKNRSEKIRKPFNFLNYCPFLIKHCSNMFLVIDMLHCRYVFSNLYLINPVLLRFPPLFPFLCSPSIPP